MVFIKYLKKDVNKILLFITLIPIILFIALDVHYENSVKNINNEYNKKLEEITGKIVLERLNETAQLKETNAKAKGMLEERYSDLKSENEGLVKQKDKLQIESDSLKGQLQSQNTKFNKLQSDFNQIQNSLIEANEAISRLTARANELCRKLKEAGGSDEKC